MKIKIKILVLLIALSTLTSAGFMVINAEKQKRMQKFEAEKDYYSQLYKDWESYSSEYSQQVAQLKEEKKVQMDQAKKNYEELLAQQPAIVKQHTKTEKQTVAVNTGASQVSSSKAASGQNVGVVTTKSSSKIKVTKPSSTPKTATS